jgi:hypothetical protein
MITGGRTCVRAFNYIMSENAQLFWGFLFLILLVVIITSPIWLTIIYFVRKHKEKKRLYQERYFFLKNNLETTNDDLSDEQYESPVIEKNISEPLSEIDIETIIAIIVLREIENAPLDDQDQRIIDLSDQDPLFDEAARLVVMKQQGSTSLIQRKFAIGYHRAGRLMDQLEIAGIVGPTDGSNARQVLIQDEYSLGRVLNNLDYDKAIRFIKNDFYTDEQIEEVSLKYRNEIEQKKLELENVFRLEEEQRKKEALEYEKAVIKAELLEIERKRQLRRQVKKELMEEGVDRE